MDPKLKRTRSAKVKAEQLQSLLAEQRARRSSSATARQDTRRKADEDQARLRRMRQYEKVVADIWDREWEAVQLTRLPSDLERADEQGRRGVSERYPELPARLASLLQGAFQPLFDTYLYYCKVEAESATGELYRMADFNWKSLLRDASLVGEGKGQLRTTAVSAIFKSVNQRRDNLAKNKGAAAQRENASGKPAEGTPAAYTDAVLQIASLGTHGGTFANGVTPHYAAGSLYGFTFSEFLEGLIHVAVQLPPVAGQSRPGASGLTEGYVLSQLGWVVHDRILLDARRGEVLEFRRMVVESPTLSEAAEAISPMLDPLYARQAELPSRLVGCSLKAFQDMCTEAELVGQGLSLMDIKSAFVHSLLIGADEDGTRKPLLDRNEFDEAVMRLALHFEPPAADETGRGGGRNAGGRVAARKALVHKAAEAGARVSTRSKAAVADKLASKVKSQLASARPLGEGTPALEDEPAQGGEGAVAADAGVAVEEEEELHVEEAVASKAQEESIIVERLPILCGKLLALLDA